MSERAPFLTTLDFLSAFVCLIQRSWVMGSTVEIELESDNLLLLQVAPWSFSPTKEAGECYLKWHRRTLKLCNVQIYHFFNERVWLIYRLHIHFNKRKKVIQHQRMTLEALHQNILRQQFSVQFHLVQFKVVEMYWLKKHAIAFIYLFNSSNEFNARFSFIIFTFYINNHLVRYFIPRGGD